MDENVKLIMAEFAKVNTKLDNIDTRVSGLETRMTSLEKTVEKLDTKMSGLDTRMTSLEKMVEKLDTMMSGLDTRMTSLEKTTEKLGARLTDVETLIREAKLDKVSSRLGMLELKLDKLQDNYEKMDADVRVLSGETASGFYKIKHQLRQVEDQGRTIVKVLELRNLIPYRDS